MAVMMRMAMGVVQTVRMVKAMIGRDRDEHDDVLSLSRPAGAGTARCPKR